MPLWLLCATVVLTGSAVIMIEVLGSRIVGPFFGVSLYIWTALISVALIALSLGYYLGGIVADRFPRAIGLYGMIAGALVTTLLIPLYDRELCLWASDPDQFSIKTGVLVASLLLFMPPLTFLGFVAPYALRLALRDLDHAGRIAGLLYAISTVGSVLGAVIAGFYLVPALGVTMTLVIIAGALALPCLLWGIVGRRPAHAAGVVVFAVGLAALGIWRAEARPMSSTDEFRLLAEREGRYARIAIAEIPRVANLPDSEWVRWIMIDGIPQTGVIPAREFRNFTPLHTIQSEFYRLHDREPETALVIGLGGGAVPMALAQRGIDVEVVDIDPLIVEMATEWMGFDPARAPVHLMDGRAFIRHAEKQYDLVIFDVASGGAQPFHLFTQEIFEETAAILNPGGVMAINYIGFARGRRDFLARSVFTTVTSVFPESITYVYPRRRGDDVLCNIMFFFSNEPFRPDRSIRDDPETSSADRRLLEDEFMPLIFDLQPNGYILTDDRNPIERHSVEVNEIWRKQIFQHIPRGLMHRVGA